MGRTPLSWGLITIFYIIYYTILALFWALMIFVFMQTLTDGREGENDIRRFAI
jgi:hypothetical protein